MHTWQNKTTGRKLTAREDTGRKCTPDKTENSTKSMHTHNKLNAVSQLTASCPHFWNDFWIHNFLFIVQSLHLELAPPSLHQRDPPSPLELDPHRPHPHAHQHGLHRHTHGTLCRPRFQFLLRPKPGFRKGLRERVRGSVCV